jgi:integrase
MARRRAKMIEDRQLELALLSIKGSDTEKRDKVFLLFSCKAGLRAQEIALMPWSNVTDGEGSIGTEIRVDSYIAKGHRERTIPMHRDLYNALSELRMERPQDKFVAYSIRPGFKYMTANAMAQWFRRFYAGLGFDSTSSHSGRRTFCTRG